MSWVAVGIGAASLVMGGVSMAQSKKAGDKEADLQRRAGAARANAANLEAAVLEQQASNSIGAAQRDAADVARESRLAQSRAIALAAASGGGASTAPTVVKLVSNLAKEGSYNAARALYAGQEKARLQRLQARELREMGEFAIVGGNITGDVAAMRGEAGAAKTAGSMLETGSSLYTKYRSANTPNSNNTGTPTSEFTYTGTGIQGDYQYG